MGRRRPGRWILLTALLITLGFDASGQDPDGRPQAREAAPLDTPRPAASLVGRLDFERFKGNIARLAGFETRYFNTDGNREALAWLEEELRSYGYEVERHTFIARSRRGISGGIEIDNLYATKVGTKHPDEMVIVSAHMDSYNTDSPDQSFAPGANDDASGSSLVLEAARAFGGADVEVERSVRFILWNAEEIGLIGSRAYVDDRAKLQGVEEPAGSGRYPEPRWVAMIQHDMLLFDHGMPRRRRGQEDMAERVSDEQSRFADIDVEYRARSRMGNASRTLAAQFLTASIGYCADYPVDVGSNMSNTDSVPFAEHCPSISIRENRRTEEIGRGAAPHWHKDSDRPETYSEADYRLGFDAVRLTVGAVAEMVGFRVRERL